MVKRIKPEEATGGGYEGEGEVSILVGEEVRLTPKLSFFVKTVNQL